MKYQGMPMIFMRRDGYTDSATSEEILMKGLHSRLPKFDMEIIRKINSRKAAIEEGEA